MFIIEVCSGVELILLSGVSNILAIQFTHLRGEVHNKPLQCYTTNPLQPFRGVTKNLNLRNIQVEFMA